MSGVSNRPKRPWTVNPAGNPMVWGRDFVFVTDFLMSVSGV